MTQKPRDTSIKDLDTYFRSSESWAQDQEAARRSTLRIAWITAGVLGVVALAEAIAIVVMTPLKTVQPYTLLVDKQTGYVEALKPLERETIAPDRALTRSFIAQYVLAREGFDGSIVRNDYRKVALWSSGEARDRYVAEMQGTNPASPLVRLPRGTTIDVVVRGITSLNNETALVRYSTVRTDPGGQPQSPQPWQAVVTWRFTGAAMSEADRLTNPLGFQVVHYRRNAEVPIEVQAAEPPSPPLATPQVLASPPTPMRSPATASPSRTAAKP